MADIDIVAREAHVIGSGQRIAPLEYDEIDESVWESARELRAATGGEPVKSMSTHLRTLAKHPGIFRGQVVTSIALFHGAIPKRERELIILRIGWLTQTPYEWGEHVTIGKRVGLTSDEIERVREDSAAAGWSDQDATILRGVEELLADHALSDGTWQALAAIWDETRLIEYLALVGQYLGVALMQNTLRIQLGPSNPGLGSR